MYVHDHLGRPLTSARMSVHGTGLHYRIGGEGEPVVLLHGAPKTSYHWRDVVPHLTPHRTGPICAGSASARTASSARTGAPRWPISSRPDTPVA